MRLPLTFLALSLSAPAFAGGFGVTGTAGFRSDTVYFYDSSNDMAQYRQQQTLPTYGTGLEFILGDRDDKVNGVFRGFWLQDSAQKDPAGITETVAPDAVVADVRDEARNIGIATFGVQWGFYGSPDKFMTYAITSAGAGFLTEDHTEFLIAQAGGGAAYRVNRSFQAYADVEYSLRYRKGFTHGANMFVGARYLFD